MVSAITVVIQTFTANGTYTPTADLQYAIIECIGGGGAGGGAVATSDPEGSSVGGGGGAGEYSRGVFSAGTIGASQAVVIGSGGSGVAGLAGGAGTASNVGALISSNGGAGGQPGSLGLAAVAVGGLGGTGGAGGAFRAAGMAGYPGYDTALVNYSAGFSGAGGSSQYGAGGIAVTTIVGGTNPGSVALGYGSGGSGAINKEYPEAAAAGGNGTAGIVIITEYVLN